MNRNPVRPEWIYGPAKPAERPAWVSAPGCCERWTPADGCADGHTGRPAMSTPAREFAADCEAQ